MKASELQIGERYAASRMGQVIVLAVGGWTKHPRYREFTEDPRGRGIAIAHYTVSWNGIVKWIPEVVQAKDIVAKLPA